MEGTKGLDCSLWKVSGRGRLAGIVSCDQGLCCVGVPGSVVVVCVLSSGVLQGLGGSVWKGVGGVYGCCCCGCGWCCGSGKGVGSGEEGKSG